MLAYRGLERLEQMGPPRGAHQQLGHIRPAVPLPALPHCPFRHHRLVRRTPGLFIHRLRRSFCPRFLLFNPTPPCIDSCAIWAWLHWRRPFGLRRLQPTVAENEASYACSPTKDTEFAQRKYEPVTHL